MAQTTKAARAWPLGPLGLLLAMLCGCFAAPQPAGQRGVATAAPAPAATPLDSDLALAPVDSLAIAVDGPGVQRLCDDNLALARTLIARIEQQDVSQRSFESTLGRLDAALWSISNAAELPHLLGVVHPSVVVRQAARACETHAAELLSSIWMDPELAAVIEAYGSQAPRLRPERQRFLLDTLRDFKRSGAGLPAAEQQRLSGLNREITEIGQLFVAEINGSPGRIRIAPQALAGLPDWYRRAHQAEGDGLITITTDYPDYYPFIRHADDRDSALRLYVQFCNRGGQDNLARLRQLLALRHAKARMLGYDSWADYAIEPQLAGSAAAARAFLERLRAVVRPLAAQEAAELRAERAQLDPEATEPLRPPDRYYLSERLRRRRCGLDSRELARSFEIRRVLRGLLALTSEMYGLSYQEVPAPSWHAEVIHYQVRSTSGPLGRIHLDLFSRPYKYPHVAMFAVAYPRRFADGAHQQAEAALVGNFPRPGEPMAHQEVVTLFHEFGHVLHHLLTEAELLVYAGTNTARDFVEVPSQLFEQWAWSHEVLSGLARPRPSGEPLPRSIHDALICSRRVGLGLYTEQQLFLASLDLAYHSRPPGFDTTQLLQAVRASNSSLAHVEGTHFESSFGHLIGYDAGYYGYLWGMALAQDALTRFRAEGLLDPHTAQRWRAQVLAPGGGVDGRELLRRFLGRAPDEQAYVRFLRGTP